MNLNKKHYVCRGECSGVSDQEGTCQAKNCSCYGEPLEGCNCEDSLHTEMREKEKEGGV